TEHVAIDNGSVCLLLIRPIRRRCAMRPGRQYAQERRSLRSRLVVAAAVIAAIALVPVDYAQTAGAAGVVPVGPVGPVGHDAPVLAGYQLTSKDDFNGAAGKPVEPGKWIYDTGTGYGCVGCPNQWGTAEIESMTDSTENVSIDGPGNLLITPLKQPGGPWTSA